MKWARRFHEKLNKDVFEDRRSYEEPLPEQVFRRNKDRERRKSLDGLELSRSLTRETR